MNSIEQSSNFNLARRIARVVAPEFRIFATPNLGSGETVLDMSQKTIEVAEGTDQLEAVAAVLFQLGHIRLRSNPEYREHSGDIGDINEQRLINKLVRQGQEADVLAYTWAVEMMFSMFDVDYPAAESFVGQYVWSENDWKIYYAS